MTKAVHSAYVWAGWNAQDYDEYKKFVGRYFYVRGLAENVSMVAWLGWVVGLHYGWNTKVSFFSFHFVHHEGSLADVTGGRDRFIRISRSVIARTHIRSS